MKFLKSITSEPLLRFSFLALSVTLLPVPHLWAQTETHEGILLVVIETQRSINMTMGSGPQSNPGAFMTSKGRYELLENGQLFSLELPSQTWSHPIKPKSWVRVRGNRIGKKIQLADLTTASIQRVAVQPHVLSQAYAAAPAGLTAADIPLGGLRTAVVLVNFSDNPTNQPYTAAQASDVVFNQNNVVYNHESYNRTWFYGDVYGYYTIDATIDCTNTPLVMAETNQVAMNAGVNLNNYQYVQYVLSRSCGWAGTAYLGGPWSFVANGHLDVRTSAHELGHNLGLFHASTMNCGSIPFNPNALCGISEYGNTFDIMSSGGDQSRHINAMERTILGWITPQTVTTSGIYTLHPMDFEGSAVKALKLQSSSPSQGTFTYYLEYHQPTGPFPFSQPEILNGVMINLDNAPQTQGYFSGSFLLDMTPGDGLVGNAPLLVGQSYTDPGSAGFTITPLSNDANGIQVQITFPGGGGGTPPSITSAGTAIGSVGTAFIYTITATHNPTAYSVTGPLPPGVSFSGNTLSGTPTASGTFNVTLGASNGSGPGSAPLSITINPPPAPTANSQSITTAFNTSKPITLSGSDPNNLTLTYIAVSNPSHGSLSAVTGSQISYTPSTGYTGADSFTFKVNNGFVDSPAATISITVNPPAAPVANPQAVATAFNTSTPFTLTGSDANNLPLTYVIVAHPLHGSLSGSGANQTFTPTSGYSGLDSFTFKVNNGFLDSNVATVSLTVNPPGTPLANHQTVITAFNTALGITLTASDPNNLSLTYSLVALPTHGILSGTGAHQTYTPTSGYSGLDNFTFKVNNGTIDSNVAVITITVQPPANQTPVAQNQSLAMLQDTTLAVQLQATDPDGNSLTYSIVTGAGHGTLTGTPPAVTYRPATGYFGSDSFTFKANDGLADSNVAMISFIVTASILPPPDLGFLDGRTFTLHETLALTYHSLATGFNWEFNALGPSQAGSLGFVTSNANASSLTTAPRFNLASLSLSPGRYQVRVQAINGNQMSSWASATISLVSANLAHVRVYPNPWRSDRGYPATMTFDQLPANSTVKLFTVSGRWMKTLSASSGSVPWDMKNDSGESVASGIYLYLVTDGQGNKTRGKFTVIK